MEEMDELSHYDESGEDVADVGNEVGQSVELLVERRLHGVVDLRLHEHFAHLGGVANFQHAHHAMALHHLGAAKHVVGGIGGFLVEACGVSGLGA